MKRMCEKRAGICIVDGLMTGETGETGEKAGNREVFQ